MFLSLEIVPLMIQEIVLDNQNNVQNDWNEVDVVCQFEEVVFIRFYLQKLQVCKVAWGEIDANFY